MSLYFIPIGPGLLGTQINEQNSDKIGLPVGMQIKVSSRMFTTHSKFNVELDGLLTDDLPKINL